MNYIDIILFICFIILCSITIYTLYNRIEGFANPVEVPTEVKEFIKIVGKLGEQANKVADALEKTQRSPTTQTVSSASAVDTSSAAFLKGAKQLSADEAKREVKKQSEQSSSEQTEKITITTKARNNNKLPIFDHTTFNEFIAANPTPTLEDIYPFIKDIKEYQNLLDVLYDIVINEVTKMNDQLNKRESFITEAFRTVCCNVPDDSKEPVKVFTQIEKDATLERIKTITTQLQSQENMKKMLLIDAAFSKMNEIKTKAEKGKTEDVINEYAPDARGGEND